MIHWIVSTLIVLLMFWIGYCFHQRIEYDSYFEERKFKELIWYDKLIVITLWLVIIIFAIELFIGLVIITKEIIFGGN